MTVAIVGGTGLIGRHVVEELGRRDANDVIATWHSRQPYATSGVRWIQGDLSRHDHAERVLEAAEEAVVCVGQLSTSAVLRSDPLSSILQTLRVVTNVFEAAARQKLQRVIFVSSCTGYPSMTNPACEPDMFLGDPPAQWFGVGWMHRYLEKQLAWYVDHLGLIGSAVVLRPSLVYGPYDDFSRESGHFVPALIRQVAERLRPVEIWGDGHQTRNLLHAADLADAILLVLQRREPGLATFNVTSDRDVSVNEVVRYLAEIDGFADMEVAHDLTKGGGPAALGVSGAAFTQMTGWRTRRDIRTGLSETLRWFRSKEGQRSMGSS